MAIGVHPSKGVRGVGCLTHAQSKILVRTVLANSQTVILFLARSAFGEIIDAGGATACFSVTQLLH